MDTKILVKDLRTYLYALEGGCGSHNPEHSQFYDHGEKPDGTLDIFCKDCQLEVIQQLKEHLSGVAS